MNSKPHPLTPDFLKEPWRIGDPTREEIDMYRSVLEDEEHPGWFHEPGSVIRTRMLHAQRMRHQALIDEYRDGLLADPDHWRQYVHEIANKMAVELSISIWKEVYEVEDISYPCNWWEAFKERWFPNWLIKWIGVKYYVHDLRAERLYPEFKPALAKEKSVLQVTSYHEEKPISVPRNKRTRRSKQL